MLRAGEDYLEAILSIEKKQGHGGVRITDVAHNLSVTKPSVIRSIKALMKDGYVNQEAYGDIYLTEKGRLKASQVLSRHTTIRKFLIDVLGVEEEQADRDACKIEHVVSSETMEKLSSFVAEEEGKRG